MGWVLRLSFGTWRTKSPDFAPSSVTCKICEIQNFSVKDGIQNHNWVRWIYHSDGRHWINNCLGGCLIRHSSWNFGHLDKGPFLSMTAVFELQHSFSIAGITDLFSTDAIILSPCSLGLLVQRIDTNAEEMLSGFAQIEESIWWGSTGAKTTQQGPGKLFVLLQGVNQVV